MSNIKKGAKLTVSTGNGISRHTTQNLGILEVSGPAMSDTTTDYTTNTAQLTIGATDVSGVLKLGINNDGNTFIDAIKHNNHTDIIMQKYGGLGNGLAIAKHFIELHGGAILMEPTPSNGSRFSIFLPIRNCLNKKKTQLAEV